MTPETAIESLPNDLGQCHALLHRQDALIEELTATVRLQGREKLQLLHRVQPLRDVPSETHEGPAASETLEGETAPKKKGHGRRKPPVELPRLPLEHPVPDADKVCPECSRAKKRIGEAITEQLEYAPASLFVIEHIQPKYACACCQQGVTVAPKPPQPIERGLPGPGLLAQVVASKYGDHLPLYRQGSIFKRHGLELSRQTMCGWVLAAAHLLQPVAERPLRGIAIGRRNYLFMGRDRRGRAAAVLYSMIHSATDHALDPFLYLRDLFLRIPTHPNKDIHQLLPDHWKREIFPTLAQPPRP